MYLSSTSLYRFIGRFLPIIALLSMMLLALGFYQALFVSPPDYQQGESVRMMYVHVPAAWMSLFLYALLGGMSAAFLIWRNPLYSIIAKEAAIVGIVFTLITLATGMLWGKPIWGVWWVWDARLTSVLFLFFLYWLYLGLSNGFADNEKGEKITAIVGLIGCINLPIIKFSVEWWNTLHQPASILRVDGPSIHESMLTPLLMLLIGYLALATSIIALRLQTGYMNRKIKRRKRA